MLLFWLLDVFFYSFVYFRPFSSCKLQKYNFFRKKSLFSLILCFFTLSVEAFYVEMFYTKKGHLARCPFRMNYEK